MTIHHDKLAYGKLKSLQEDMSEDDILALLEELNAKDEQDEDEEE